MQFRNSANSYGAVAKGFHWLTAALVILAWALGSFDDVLPKGPARAAGLFVHMSAGLTIIAALAARLLWRLADAPPLPEPSALGVWLDRAGRLAHIALYALLAAVPVAGIVLQFARGDALPLPDSPKFPRPGSPTAPSPARPRKFTNCSPTRW